MKIQAGFRRFSLRVILHWPQYFFLVVLFAIANAQAVQLHPGNTYPLVFTDVDRHQLSTTDGHVTVISVVTNRDEAKAQTVGDRVTQFTLGDPKVRLINLVNFQQNIISPLRGMVSAIIRHRLDTEAQDVQKIYAARHINRNARNDIYVVADFDGKAVTQLGIAPTSPEFAVFVFDGHGRLVRRWNDVPSLEMLTQAIKEAR
ncbi:MAG TPA: hypothetical protein VE086_03800 [Chthoniobacterales bacterium]|nr:hypothetical protein [Chthoniobacterales bacterium]